MSAPLIGLIVLAVFGVLKIFAWAWDKVFHDD